MKLESQVCSLELAKELKELGVKQESFFRHMSGTIMCRYEQRQYPTAWDSGISAFTVAELGELLPKQIEYKTNDYGDRAGYRNLDLKIGKTIINDGWYVMYSDPHPSNKVPVYAQHADTEADARAKCLIHLIKNDLYTPLNKN